MTKWSRFSSIDFFNQTTLDITGVDPNIQPDLGGFLFENQDGYVIARFLPSKGDVMIEVFPGEFETLSLAHRDMVDIERMITEVALRILKRRETVLPIPQAQPISSERLEKLIHEAEMELFRALQTGRSLERCELIRERYSVLIEVQSLRMEKSTKQMEAIDRLDRVVCNFLNGVGDEYDPKLWHAEVKANVKEMSEAYNECHQTGIMRLGRAVSRKMYDVHITPAEELAKWAQKGPELALAAGCYVGITISDAPTKKK